MKTHGPTYEYTVIEYLLEIFRSDPEIVSLFRLIVDPVPISGRDENLCRSVFVYLRKLIVTLGGGPQSAAHSLKAQSPWRNAAATRQVPGPRRRAGRPVR